MTPTEAQDILDFVKNEIKNEGRTVTFLAFDKTTPDPAAPHKFNSPADSAATPQDADAVFVPISSLSQLGIMGVPRDLAKETSKVALIAPVDNVDFNTFSRMTDEGETFTITFVDQLRPGNYTFLWYVGVKG